MLALTLAAALAASPATTHRLEVGGDSYRVDVRGNEARVRRRGFRLNGLGDWQKARAAAEQATGCRVVDSTLDRVGYGPPVMLRALLDCPGD